jgi:ribosomal peptide maturation radical SAM protein 1
MRFVSRRQSHDCRARLTAKEISLSSVESEWQVLLFSTPWMMANWPCLAIGTLKSFLREGGVVARCCHLHLEAAAALGWARYDAFADTWGAGEALFGALLDPGDAERLLSVSADALRARGHSAVAKWVEETALGDVRASIDAWLEREQPERYAVVGGSIGALQLSSTLYLMKRIRERGHVGVRVLGGSGLVGAVASEVLQRCRDVDAVIDGEGEKALLEIAQSVMDGSGALTGIPGVVTRDGADRIVHGGIPSTVDMSATPAADLAEFFDAATVLRVPKTTLTLSFEYSRGCYWEHRTKGELRGCTFCGLYRNSPDHRRRPAARVIRDIAEAVQRFRVLNVAFVDAYLPQGYRDELLEGLAKLTADVSIFSEMRCDFTRSTVQRLASRASRLQLGVESFSSAILRLVGKGVTAAHSVYAVRLCQEHGIRTQYNLMTRIPGVPCNEIDELCKILPSLFGLIPPHVTEFYLDRNSLMFAAPEAYGITAESLDAERPPWLAQCLGDSRISQVVPFVATDSDADVRWSTVKELVAEWERAWDNARAAQLPSPLAWRDGGGWASIIDLRQETGKTYVLDDVLYDVFISCGEVISEHALIRRLPHHAPAKISEAISELTSHGLIFHDGTLFVSLPVRVSPRCSNG